MDPPQCVQNAMMTKDKKPFTYTPGGIDLSEVRSPRMARRIERNAHLPGSGENPRPTPHPHQDLDRLPASTLAAMRPQPQVQVFPSPPPAVPFKGAVPPPPPPPSQRIPPPPPPPSAPLPTQKVKTGDNQVLERPDMTKIIPDNPMTLLRRTGGPQPRKSLVDEMFAQAGKPSAQMPSPTRFQANSNERAGPQPASPVYKPQPDQQYQPVKFQPQQHQPYEPSPPEAVGESPRYQPPKPDQYREPQQQVQTSTAHLGSLYIPPVVDQQKRPAPPDRSQDSPKLDSPSLREAPKPWQIKKPQQEETPAWAKKDNESTPWPQSRTTRPNQADQQQQQFQQQQLQQHQLQQQQQLQQQRQQPPVGVRIEVRAKPAAYQERPEPEERKPNAVYVTQPLILQHPGPPPRQTAQQPDQRGVERRGERIIPIRIEGSSPGSERSFQRQQSNPTQSNKFKIIQKFTNTEEDDAESSPITEHSPKYPQNFQQQQVSRGPQHNVNNGQHVRSVPINMEGNEPQQQQYVHPSQQVVPEPKKYTGSSIPGRSFRILQAMTAPENNCANASDQNEAFQYDEWEYNRPCLPYPYLPPYYPHPPSETESTPTPRPPYPPYWCYSPIPQNKDCSSETCKSCGSTSTPWSYAYPPDYYDPYYHYYYGYAPMYPAYPYYATDGEEDTENDTPTREIIQINAASEDKDVATKLSDNEETESDDDLDASDEDESGSDADNPHELSIILEESERAESRTRSESSTTIADDSEDETEAGPPLKIRVTLSEEAGKRVEVEEGHLKTFDDAQTEAEAVTEEDAIDEGKESDESEDWWGILGDEDEMPVKRTYKAPEAEPELATPEESASRDEEEQSDLAESRSKASRSVYVAEQPTGRELMQVNDFASQFDEDVKKTYKVPEAEPELATPEEEQPDLTESRLKASRSVYVAEQPTGRKLMKVDDFASQFDEDVKKTYKVPETEPELATPGEEQPEVRLKSRSKASRSVYVAEQPTGRKLMQVNDFASQFDEDEMPVKKTYKVPETEPELATPGEEQPEVRLKSRSKASRSVYVAEQPTGRKLMQVNDFASQFDEDEMPVKKTYKVPGAEPELATPEESAEQADLAESRSKASRSVYVAEQPTGRKLMQVDDFASQFARIREDFGKWNFKVAPKKKETEASETISASSTDYTEYNCSKSSASDWNGPVEICSDGSDELGFTSDEDDDVPEATKDSSSTEEVKVPSIKERIQALKDSIEEKQRKIQENKIELRVKDRAYCDSTKSSVKSLEEFSEEEEIDSGVTSDMSRHISDSEESPELRRLTRYQRAATHSRLFKLLQEECDTEDRLESAAREEQSSRRHHLTLPLRDSYSCAERLVNETVQSFLKHKKAQVFRDVAEEKLRAAAARALEEEPELFETPSTDGSGFLSPRRSSTGYSTTVPTPQEFTDEYRQYYETWRNVDACNEEYWSGSKNAKCPRIASPQSIHRKMMKLLSPDPPQTPPPPRTKSNDVTSAS